MPARTLRAMPSSARKPTLLSIRTSKPIGVGVAAFALAACSQVLSGDGRRVPADRIQLFPAGPFRGASGRPDDVPHWYMDAAAAASIIADCSARAADLVVDYDHHSLHADKGVKAVAAAWFKGADLEWVEGEGLFARNPAWTAVAAAHIEADEYRYISPLFAYDKKTGVVKALINASLVNTPDITSMEDVADWVATSLLSQPSPQESAMDELLERLQWLLNLPVGASVEDIVAHLQKLIDQLKPATGEAAASFDLIGHLVAMDQRLAAASAVDPAKFVPITDLQAVRAELNVARGELDGLRKQATDKAVDDLVVVALNDGRLLPAQETWARSLGGADIDALKGYLDTAQPIAALSATQTQGKPPVSTGAAGALSETELAVCSRLGLTPEAYQANKAEQAPAT